MGLSRLRLVSILVVTLIFGWTMLRTNTGELETSNPWTAFTKESTTIVADPAQQAHDAKKVADEEALLTAIDTANASGASDAGADSVGKVGQVEKVGGSTNEVLEKSTDQNKDKGADAQQSSDALKTTANSEGTDTSSKTGSLHSTSVAKEAGQTDAKDKTDSKAEGGTLADLTIPEKPAKAMTDEEKEEEKKRLEKEHEELKRKLEREHDALREASLKQLQGDAAMQARINVTLEDVGIVMRTGKDVKHRLAAPLSTWASSRTPDNLVIFSDQDGDFDGWKLQDAIKPWVDRPAIRDTPAAKFWRESNAGKESAKDKVKRFDGWNLDALKFVSSVHLGYQQLRQKRDFKWYIFADDDTYWHLPTLVKLLSNLDYEMEYYTGGVSYFGIPFAHGGAGAVASAGAMKKRFMDHADTIANFHDIGATAQYGDTNLARAFEAVDIYFDHSFREAFNGEDAWSRPLDSALICQHAVTFHHLPMDFFARFHERVKNLSVLRYIDVMSALADPDRPMTNFWHKQDWTFNLDREDVGTAEEAKGRRDKNWAFTVPERHRDMLSTRACQEMCRDNEKCVAWTYIESERTCLMSEWFRLGQERRGSVSGVDAIKLSDWTDTCTPWWPKQY